jgi:DNA-binding XRE family transcriptional regulator
MIATQEIIGHRTKMARHEINLTQSQLAENIGLS